MMRVAILDDYQKVAERMADWESLGNAVDITVFHDHVADRESLVERLFGFDVIVVTRERTPFPGPLIDRLPRLKLLVTAGMRNLSIDLAAATARGVIVSGTENVGFTTAELTWGLILALCRRIPREDHALRNGRWQTTVGEGLHGKTLGIVGLGKLGGHVAKIGLAFGMNVLAWSQNLTAERCAEAGVGYATKPQLLARSDIVTIHLVLGERTRGLIGRDDFHAMKGSAYLINTSRAGIVDQHALAEALRSGTIAGAGLDVFDVEPLPRDHPVLGLPNTVLTPHLGYVTDTNYGVWFGQYVEDIRAWLAGRPLRVLNPDVLDGAQND